MRNQALEKLAPLIGRWKNTMLNAWFEAPGAEFLGTTTIEWLGDALIVARTELQGTEATLAIGRNDARDAYTVLTHDDRGVCRVFAMTFDGRRWTLSREDPDFHQRFIADVEEDRIAGRWEASEDEGRSWRKDFDLLFERDQRKT